MAYTYYLLKLEFDNGISGFVKLCSDGGYTVTDDMMDCLVFDSESEASDFYYDRIGKDTTLDGGNISRVSVSTINSERPL